MTNNLKIENIKKKWSFFLYSLRCTELLTNLEGWPEYQISKIKKNFTAVFFFVICLDCLYKTNVGWWFPPLQPFIPGPSSIRQALVKLPGNPHLSRFCQFHPLPLSARQFICRTLLTKSYMKINGTVAASQFIMVTHLYIPSVVWKQKKKFLHLLGSRKRCY